MRDQPGVAQVNTSTQLLDASYTIGLEALLQLDLYYPCFSDVRYELMPGWTGDIGVGASYGTGYAYDTHMPLMWWGSGVLASWRVSVTRRTPSPISLSRPPCC